VQKLKKAYILYGTEAYFPVMEQCALSITDNSDVCVLIYCINSVFKSDQLAGRNIIVIPWAMRLSYSEMYKSEDDGNFYIKRGDVNIYAILTERIKILKDALWYRAETVVYIDSDSIATEYIDRIFDMYHDEPFVMATEGIYDWMFYNGRGACETRADMTGTVEYNACQLFGVDQIVRQRYRTTNLFIAGQKSLGFIDEWWCMATNIEVMFNREFYAPYHEETLYNVLLWKHGYIDGLPYLYMNGSVEEVNGNYKFTGDTYFLSEWKRVPEKKEDLLVYHGEKRIDKMIQMRNKMNKQLRVLYLAPHLSTGGMPAFLLKRIQTLNHILNIYVVEYANWSDEYTVQKDKIKELVGEKFFTLGENKMELIDILNKHNIDLIHVEEMVEDSGNAFPTELLKALYKNNRPWKIVETCHNIVFKPDIEKIYHPDAYAFCTTHHLKTFSSMPSLKRVIEFPIEANVPTRREKKYAKMELGLDINKKHVINVGLFTPGKNQEEGFKIARNFDKDDVEFHFIGNQAENFRQYWEPLNKKMPYNVRVWKERKDVALFMKAADAFMFNSTWECNPLVLKEAIGYGLPILARNLPQYEGAFDPYITNLQENIAVEQLRGILFENTKKRYRISMRELSKFHKGHLNLYSEVMKNKKMGQEVTVNVHFVGKPFLEIKGATDSNYRVKFLDENSICIYENTIKSNHWVRLNREWFTKWRVMVWEDEKLIFDYELSYVGRRVYIALDSKSLGDTIAWIPYVLEFQKKHKCEVIVSTFKNELFESVYPELKFVEPGTVVENLYGMYCVGWFYNPDKEPVLPNTIPLQKAASNILGLEYKEIVPRIRPAKRSKYRGKKYVTIATNSTAECKFWTREGWQELIDYLVEQGFIVINVSLEENKFKGALNLLDKSMGNTMSLINESQFFIGLSSGLSWLAWALNKKVVMISNFTDPDHEFQCVRVTKESVCHGCWNSPKYKFDKSWEWCPVHKGTPRQFECQRSITAKEVIEKIKSEVL